MLNKEAKLHENLEFLRRFVGSDANPKFFFTMTEINKVGINPRSQYGTPLGVYCYPLIQDFYQKLLENSLPFAGSKPYINLFTINVPTLNMTTYTDADLRRDVDKLKLIYGIQEGSSEIDPALQQKYDAARKAYDDGSISYTEYDKIYREYYKAQEEFEKKVTQHTVDKAFREARGGTPISKFWNLTRILSGNAKNWSVLLRRLGYTNFYDPGTGLIHPNEPTQAVILDPSTIIVVESFHNPHARVDPYYFPHMPEHEKKMMVQRQQQMERLEYRLESLNNPAMLDKVAHSHIKNPRIMSAIVRNEHTPSETLKFIYDNTHDPSDMFYNFISNKNTPTDVLVKIFDAGGGGYKESIVRHQNAPIDLIKRMADSEDYEERYIAAQSPRVPVEVLRKLVKDENEGVRSAAVHAAPPELLKELAADPNSSDETKVAITDSYQVTPEILDMLSKDPSSNVRARVVTSGKATPEMLHRLVHDENRHVRLLIAQSSNANQETLAELTKDPDLAVVEAVASNEMAPPAILEQLSHDPRETVRYYVLRNYSRPIEVFRTLANDTSPRILEYIAGSHQITPDIIPILANNPHANRRVFMQLAQNSETPVEVLQNMVKNPEFMNDVQMMMYLAENRNLTPQILTDLWNSPKSDQIQTVFARNQKTPPEVMRQLVDKFFNDRYTMETVARNPATPPELLDRLAKSEFTVVRNYVARNSNTPYATLMALSKDPNYDVRWYAGRTIEEHPETERLRQEAEEAERERQKLFQKGPIMADTKFDIQKTAKKEDNEKIPMSQVKKLPYKSLNRMIKKMKQYLKDNDVVQKMFKDYNVDISEIDYIPMMFGNLDVSAKTDHGVIILNYKLLTDGDFFKDFSYGVHEMTHWLQQTTGQKATQSSDDGSYLDNPYEQEGFQNQVEYIAEQFGEGEAENYVDDLLEHHEIDNKKEHEDKKDTLMSKVKTAAVPIVTFDYDNTIWDPQHHEYIADSVKLLRDYIKEGTRVAIVTHRDKQKAKEARDRLKSIDINIPVISCPGETFQSRALNKNKVLLALGVKVHYDDRPEYLKDAIAGGVNVRRPPATRYNQ